MINLNNINYSHDMPHLTGEAFFLLTLIEINFKISIEHIVFTIEP